MGRTTTTSVILAFLVACTPEVTGIEFADLAIGGIQIGDSEASVAGRMGKPNQRVDTGEGFALEYDGLTVYIDEHGVRELLSTNPTICTASEVCPGARVTDVRQIHGDPIFAEREDGSFLEYVPAESTCWLQLSVRDDLVGSVRSECQP